MMNYFAPSRTASLHYNCGGIVSNVNFSLWNNDNDATFIAQSR